MHWKVKQLFDHFKNDLMILKIVTNTYQDKQLIKLHNHYTVTM